MKTFFIFFISFIFSFFLFFLIRCKNKQLLEKDANVRLGASTSPHGEITDNVFFYEIEWKKLERRQLEPPFKPKIVSHQFIIQKWLILSIWIEILRTKLFYICRNIHLILSILIKRSHVNVCDWHLSTKTFYNQ